jgi:hypothetical protein
MLLSDVLKCKKYYALYDNAVIFICSDGVYCSDDQILINALANANTGNYAFTDAEISVYKCDFADCVDEG